MNSKISKNAFSLKADDVFDELFCENKRLLNELLFANKCLNVLNKFKIHLNKIYGKFETFIAFEDKLELNELTIEYKNVIDSEERYQNKPFVQKAEKIRNETIVKSNQFINKRNINKNTENSEEMSEESNQSFAESVESIGELNEIKDKIRKNQKSVENPNDLDEESEELKQKYLNRENIFDPTTNSYKCPKTDCSKSKKLYSNIRILYNHLRQSHKMGRIGEPLESVESQTFGTFDSMTNTYICSKPDCNKQFATQARVYRHLRNVHSSGPIVCDVANCGKVLKNRISLKIHMKTHSDLRPYSCELDGCRYSCKTKCALNLHLKTHTDLRPFKCHFCDKSYKVNALLKDHLLSHTNELTQKCRFDGCNQLFKTVGALRYHVDVVHYNKKSSDKPLKACVWPGCDYKSPYSCALKNHRRVHTGEKPFLCDWPECGKRFRFVHQYNDHKNIHYNYRLHMCHWPGCQYRCNDSANLRKHLRTSHNNQKFLIKEGVTSRSLESFYGQ